MNFSYLLYSPAELAQNIGENFKSLRLSKNMSRKTMAKKSGVSMSTIQRFETTGIISLESLILLGIAINETESIAKLFHTEHPNSYEALKNTKRQRGTK